MANVALVPQSDVFQGRDSVSSQNPGQPGQTFPGNRVPFVWHRARTLLAFSEEFLCLQDLRPLQVPELRCPALDTRGDQRECADKFCMNVSLDHLRRDRGWPQSQLSTNCRFDI